MQTLFVKLLEMGLAASWAVLAVLVLRALLKKAPRWTVCLLWALVALRLVCPFQIESPLSLVPDTEEVTQHVLQMRSEPAAPTPEAAPEAVGTALPDTQRPAGTATSQAPAETWQAPPASAQATDSGIQSSNTMSGAPVQGAQSAPAAAEQAKKTGFSAIGAWVWLAGFAAMLIYTLTSWLALRRRVRASIPLHGKFRLCDEIDTPFILGMLRPRVYLPSGMSEEQSACVAAHEAMHLRRGDHIWKPLGFLLLSVYWFHPLVWLSYILFCRDVELACDEAVARHLDLEGKKAYSNALLACSMPRPRVAACPLAFGEAVVRQRIRHVLNYKKPAFWIVALALLAAAVTAVCFLTAPAERPPELSQIELAEARVTDLRPDTPQSFSLTQAQLDQLQTRLRTLKTGRKDDDLNGMTPFYTLTVQAADGTEFSLAGYNDDRLTGLIGASHVWRIDDMAFCDYLAELCADGPASGAAEQARVPLTPEELARAAQVFNWAYSAEGMEDTAVLQSSCFVQITYDDVLELDLKEFLAYFAVDDAQVTQAQYDALKQAGMLSEGTDDEKQPLRRIPAAEVARTLRAYAGIGLEELTDFQTRRTELCYLEQYDAFFLSGSRTPDGFNPDSGYVLGDEAVLRGSMGISGERRVMRLAREGEGWCIRSFLPDEETAALTQDEIDRVNAAFALTQSAADGSLVVNPLCCFLTAAYDDVRRMPLAQFLRYLPDSEDDVTEAEFEALRAAGYLPEEWQSPAAMPVPLHRYPAADVDALLQAYAGVALEDMEDYRHPFSGYAYLSGYDAFYTTTSDFGLATFTCTAGTYSSTTAVLYGTPDHTGAQMVLTLRREGGSWYIHSFLSDSALQLTFNQVPLSGTISFDRLLALAGAEPHVIYDQPEIQSDRYRVVEFPDGSQAGGWMADDGTLRSVNAFYWKLTDGVDACGVTGGMNYLDAAALFTRDETTHTEADSRSPDITREILYGSVGYMQPYCYVEYAAGVPQSLVVSNGSAKMTFWITDEAVAAVGYQLPEEPMALPLTELAQRRRAGSLWNDADLTELLSGLELAFSDLYFSGAADFDSSELYLLFQLLSSADERESYFHPDDGQYHFTGAFIRSVLDRWLTDYRFDITQCAHYDAAADAVVTPVSGGFGGGFGFRMLGRSLDGSLCTILGERVDGDGKTVVRKAYILEFYDGGVYLRGARPATDEENALPREAFTGEALYDTIYAAEVATQPFFVFDDPDTLSSQNLYRLFLAWSSRDEQLACKNDSDGMLHFSEAFIRSVLDRHLRHYRLDLSQAVVYPEASYYDAAENEIVTQDLQGGGGFDSDLLSVQVDGSVITYILGFPVSDVEQKLNTGRAYSAYKEYRLEFSDGNIYILSVRPAALTQKDVLLVLQSANGDPSADLVRQFWLYSRAHPWMLGFMPEFSENPAEDWDRMTMQLYWCWLESHSVEMAMTKQDFSSCATELYGWQAATYTDHSSEYLIWNGADEAYRPAAGDTVPNGYYQLRSLDFHSDGTFTAVFDGVHFIEGELGEEYASVSDNMRVLYDMGGMALSSQPQEFAKLVYEAMRSGSLTPDETLRVRMRLQGGLEPFVYLSCSRE